MHLKAEEENKLNSGVTKGAFPSFLLTILFFIVSSCGGWMGDSIDELSGNYEFVFENNENAIIKGAGEEKIIPCSVLSHSYNDDFILAFQKAASDCILNSNLKQEEGKVYFWIIDVKADTLYRTESIEDYWTKRVELKVPENLRLQVQL